MVFITNKDKELIEFCHAYRRTVAEIGINSMFSYRGLTAITKLKGILPLPQILKICVIRGLSKDDVSSIQKSISCPPNNEYCKAFLNI